MRAEFWLSRPREICGGTIFGNCALVIAWVASALSTPKATRRAWPHVASTTRLTAAALPWVLT
eukprot:CAMPEP_0119412584 /NCGR_PEP_ID=MMETSP1335-20130426/4977_1 /TAXON_ID=259385 /ORGANISM="Chrysoculter rhomboideus, Strain RCC1486" /LENGTH=62 /DNA_ID=CAMNT_0007437337 /DNA_START=391 /DNA_END=576 /DNA_ORIENTATION=-